MLEDLTAAAFAPLLNGRFTIEVDAATRLDAELVEVVESNGEPSPDGRAPFSVVFLGPPAPLLRQAIYTLEHEELGRLELFLVPLGPDGEGTRYEAVFN